MHLTVGLLVVAVGCCAAACGGDSPEPAGGPPAVLPACAGVEAGAALPESFPQGFPLPSGTVVTSADSPFAGQLVVLGAIPGDLQEAAGFFSDALPDAGYEVGIGDAEGVESEAPFTGNGYRGKWRVNGIPQCDAVRLTLILIEQA